MMNKKIKHFIFICVAILMTISPVLTHATDTITLANNTTQVTSTNKHKTSNNEPLASPVVDNHTRKTTLNNDSRGLSGFFILGIVINIIMIIIFGRWFIKEWRSPKK